MITLFAEPQSSSQFPASYVASIVLHASLFSLLTIKILDKHRIIERFPSERYSLRVVDFHSTPPQPRQASGGGLVYRGQQSGPPPAAHKHDAGGASSGSPSITRQTAWLMPAPQTVVLPDAPKDLVIPQKMPVPLVVLWSPEKTETKKIVPPTPDKAAIAVVRPSLDTPINEENLADLKISSSVFVTQSPAILPSTTSPLVVHGPEAVTKVPQTTSRQTETPTPARVLSLSDIRVPEGSVHVPVANETSPNNTPGSMVPGLLKNSALAGTGSSTNNSNGSGAGKGSGDRPEKQGDSSAAAGSPAAHAGNGNQPGKEDGTGSGQGLPNQGAKPGTPGPAVAQAGSTVGLADGANAGSGSGNQPSSVHISLPKDGQFGVIVVGSSIAEKYPETAELWSGRLAATVYLRVGLAKNWIMQYAIPRLAEAATAGSGGRLEAPWPFEISRPDVDPGDMDADALILHGFVNKDGRFEKLEVVLPPHVLQAQMILNVLNEWQFRPAKLNGQFTAVEVLLIIPNRSE